MTTGNDLPRIGGWDFPDHRSVKQLRLDQANVERQLGELVRSTESQERIDRIIEQIQRRQDEASLATRPLRFYRYPQKSWDDTGPFVLCGRGQLVVKVDTSSDPGDAAEARQAVKDDVIEVLNKLDYFLTEEADLGEPYRDPRTQVFQSRKESKEAKELSADADALRAQGIDATMNIIVPLGHIIKGDDYPAETTGLGDYPPATAATRYEATVRVAVVDTGITPEDRTDNWLDNITRGEADIDHLDEEPNASGIRGDGRLDWFSGHGTFAAGIIQQVAPFCEIRAYRFTKRDGLGTEKHVAEALIRAAEDGARDGVRLIINASVGTPAVNGKPPLALEDAIKLIQDRYPDVLIIASAGNSGTEEEMYPAAFDGVIGVGGLTYDLQPARFSNYGNFVDVSTVAVGVVSTFVHGIEPPEPRQSFPDYTFPDNAWAVWSGTSFSAPQIAGAVALRCQEKPELTPRQALEELLEPLPELPGFGRIGLLLPGTPA